jgi:manganese transport protein
VDIVSQPGMLYVAVGIMGATVMPHNLYLHSSLVRARFEARHDNESIQAAIRYSTVDSNLALTLALLVHVAILVLAAGVFHRPGHPPITELSDAHRLLSPLLGVGAASAIFGLGLVAAGLSSSITGTLAGQVVMEGFLDMRVSRAKRALLGRLLALFPAVAVCLVVGEAGIGRTLVMTQVILGLQLPFAIVPLLWFTTRRQFLGRYAFGRLSSVGLWSIAAVVVAGNGWMIYSLL